MAYILKEITIRTNNTDDGMRKIGELWRDITNGKLPILFDNEHNFMQGISPVSRYSNYASNETGDYDLSIMGVTADFFVKMEQKIAAGEFKKYDVCNDTCDIATCTQKAWEKVWDDSKSGRLKRSFICDYESSVPAEYTKDGKAHCYLYISIEKNNENKKREK